MLRLVAARNAHIGHTQLVFCRARRSIRPPSGRHQEHLAAFPEQLVGAPIPPFRGALRKPKLLRMLLENLVAFCAHHVQTDVVDVFRSARAEPLAVAASPKMKWLPLSQFRWPVQTSADRGSPGLAQLDAVGRVLMQRWPEEHATLSSKPETLDTQGFLTTATPGRRVAGWSRRQSRQPIRRRLARCRASVKPMGPGKAPTIRRCCARAGGAMRCGSRMPSLSINNGRMDAFSMNAALDSVSDFGHRHVRAAALSALNCCT